MVIQKVLGNNVVSSRDEDNNEIVVMGRGIGFNAKSGEVIDESKINKIFVLDNEDDYYYKELVKKMPEDYIELANEIINYAKMALATELNDFIYITLTDHLNYAIERAKEGLDFDNKFLPETKRYYNSEFQVGMDAIELIKEKTGIDLPEDEAGFIAIHIINAELNSDFSTSSKLPKIIQDLISLISDHLNIVLDTETIDYERFVTHLKFFVERAVKNETYEIEDEEFCNMVINRYPDAYECVGEIDNYMKKNMNYEMSLEEEMYLTVHVKRLIHTQKK